MLYTIYYDVSDSDLCGTLQERRDAVIDQLLLTIKNEIKFESIDPKDSVRRRWRSQIIVMDMSSTHEVISILHRIEAAEPGWKLHLNHVINKIVGIAYEQQPGPEQFIEVNLTKRSLPELLDILPDRIKIGDDIVKFALSKDSDTNDGTTTFTCYALYAFGSGYEPFFYKGDKLEFNADDPCFAVTMMIGYLKFEKLMS